MKLKIAENTKHEFFIIINTTITDIEAAKLLNLSIKKYQNILINNGAFIEPYGKECYFILKEDAEKAVEVLESYIIMDKLTEE